MFSSSARFNFTYDAVENITSKKEYAYTTGTLGTATKTIPYTYDSQWKDLCISYDGKAITYDTLGNPLTYDGNTYTWQKGRQLASFSDGTSTIQYRYNSNGQRTKKIVNGVTTEYYYSGDALIAQYDGTYWLKFIYSADGDLVGFLIDNDLYYYVKNVQGDIIKIVDASSTAIITYHYDAWGNIVSVDCPWAGEMIIAELNPFRYRGYYYDTETELYYLNSRYYSAEMGRFINADDSEVLFEEQNSISEYNLFIYCLNNPVNMIDDTGYIAWWIGAVVGAVVGGLSAGIKFGTFSSKSSLTNHFSKHKSEFGDMYENVSAYENDAKYVVKNGTYIPEKNAYIKFLGNNGRANYAFVGMKSGGRISTYYVEHVSKLIQKGITLFEI